MNGSSVTGAVNASSKLAAPAPSASPANEANGKQAGAGPDLGLGTREELLAALRHSPKFVPHHFSYGKEAGEAYEELKKAPDYYLGRVEVQMLKENAEEMIKSIEKGTVMIELGCGTANKIPGLLNALVSRDTADNVFFEGIDCSADYLNDARRNLAKDCPGLKNVGTICALYMDGLQKACEKHPEKPRCALWLGSNAGAEAELEQHFKDIARISGPGTQMFFACDWWQDTAVHKAAYNNDRVENWTKLALRDAFNVLGKEVDVGRWTYEGVVNEEAKQVELSLTAPEATECGDGVVIGKGERVIMITSRKFTQVQLDRLAEKTGLHEQARWERQNPRLSWHMWSGNGHKQAK